MKKIVFITVCLLLVLLLGGCKAKEQNNMIIKSDKAVNFINEVKDADIWILPETEENLKTTLWGTATVSKTKAGESVKAPLCEPGDDGYYMFRMIDVDKFYYSANGITLKAGYTLKLKEIDINRVNLEVSDENGELINTYEVFSARL